MEFYICDTADLVSKRITSVLVWYLSGARCRLAYRPADATATDANGTASVKSRLVLPFLYRLTRVVPEKGPLNECVCVYSYALIYLLVYFFTPWLYIF